MNIYLLRLEGKRCNIGMGYGSKGKAHQISALFFTISQKK